jgi:hypothetical protein
MTKREDILTQTLIEESSLIFNMYEEAIKNIPETHWASGEINYLIPARLILHATEAADYYTTDNPRGYIWEKLFDLDPEDSNIPVEKLPSQQIMMEYHQEVRSKIEKWMSNLSIDDILKPETKFPWTGSTLLGRIIYTLGHHRQHFGELNAELRRRDLPRIKWTSLKSET